MPFTLCWSEVSLQQPCGPGQDWWPFFSSESLLLGSYRLSFNTCRFWRHNGELSLVMFKHYLTICLRRWQVYLVGDQDNLYALPSYREVMLAEGKICFKTCSRQVRIPASYFARLSETAYEGRSNEPKSIEEAVHHWLLCEILNGIGQHSILWFLVRALLTSACCLRLDFIFAHFSSVYILLKLNFPYFMVGLKRRILL